MEIRVYYEDTDAGGIVYHTNYIKYCERARSEIFFQKGMVPTLGEQRGFVVQSINAVYMATSRLGDILSIKTSVLKIKQVSLVLLQEIYKEEKKIFSMEVILVYICKSKPCSIPTEFKEIFKEY